MSIPPREKIKAVEMNTASRLAAAITKPTDAPDKAADNLVQVLDYMQRHSMIKDYP